MATTRGLEIDQSENSVQIQDFTVQDPDLVDYLVDFEPDQREEALTRALRIGVATLELSDTSKDVEFVKSEFEAMQQEFTSEIETIQEEVEEKFGKDGDVAEILDEHFGEEGTLRTRIERAFGEDGPFQERLDEELGENGERIQSALDPDREGTPTYRLKQTFKDELESVKEQITEEEVMEEIRQRTTLKGDDFEDTVSELLDDLVYQTPHEYQYTGDTEGELSGRDVGDFVLTLGDTEQRIVVEAKSEQGYSQPQIKEEMQAAIENRDADYGIFVTECESFVPKKVGYLKEFDNQILSVAVSRDPDDDLDPRLFRIGFNWARMRAVQASLETGDTPDTEVIQTKVEEVRDTVDRFRTMKKKTTMIRQNANEIDELLDECEDEVNRHLDAIVTEVSKAQS